MLHQSAATVPDINNCFKQLFTIQLVSNILPLTNQQGSVHRDMMQDLNLLCRHYTSNIRIGEDDPMIHNEQIEIHL